MLILAVSDGRAGNQRQAEALAAMVAAELGARADHHVLAPRNPWRAAAPRWLPYAGLGFDRGWRARLDHDRPALVIGCGRQAALATRIARQRLGVGTRCVQILDPRLGRNAWDLLVLPEHDLYRDEFTLTCRGSLHPVDAPWLAAAREHFPLIGDLPGPRHALLLGGPTADCDWRIEHARRWIDSLRSWRAARGGSLLLVASPRTPPTLRTQLHEATEDFELRWLGEQDGENPYPGVLAWADALLLSPDSANLLSEACATEAVVRLPADPVQQGRQSGLQSSLISARRVAWLDAQPLPDGPQVPLRETARIAREVVARLGSQLPRD